MPSSRRKRKRAGPTQNALPDALVRRFADEVARLVGDPDAARLGIAVSGGPDSVALLLLAAKAFAGRVEAATVDHGLRSESAQEARFVAQLCATWQIPHAVLHCDAFGTGNVSANARKARYAALGRWCDNRAIDWLMTAHHADDQLETMIMRLNRGSGVTGLSGVRATQQRIVRPLLHWRHDELAQIVADAGIVAIDDPTNRDDAYDRARLRKSLDSVDWIDAQAVAKSAAALADADTALEWAVDQLVQRHIRLDGATVVLDRHSQRFPSEILRRLTVRCLQRIDPQAVPRGHALTRLIMELESGGTATLGTIVAHGGKFWCFSVARARRLTRGK